MAHAQLCKSPTVAPMLSHYERRAELENGYQRENIDPTRTHLNYDIGDRCVQERIKECIELHNAAGRALRGDATLMVDWVVTMPENVPMERHEEFFRNTLEFVQQRYGSDNVPIAYVHMDERRPHAHIPVVPFNEKVNRLQASSIINRTDLQTFHGALGDYLEQRMGFRPTVELTEEQKATRVLKYVPLQEYKLAKDAVNQELKEMENQTLQVAQRLVDAEKREQEALKRLELVRRREREARERTGQLRTERDTARERLERAQERIPHAREQAQEATKAVETLKQEIGRARAGIERLEAAIKEQVERIREMFRTFNRNREDAEEMAEWGVSQAREQVYAEVYGTEEPVRIEYQHENTLEYEMGL